MKKILTKEFIFLALIFNLNVSFADNSVREPTEQELRYSYINHLNDMVSELMTQYPGVLSDPSSAYKINEFEKIDCIKIAAKSYRCNYYIDFVIGGRQQNKSTDSGIFAKSSKGWLYIPEKK